MAHGNQGHVGVSFQSSFNASNVVSLDFFPFISETLNETKPELVSEGMRSRYEQGPTFEGINEVTGDIASEVHPVLIGKVLKAWSNNCSSTLSTSYYVHTIVPAQTEFDTYAATPPMSAEVYRGTGSGMLYYNLLLNQFTLEVAHGPLLKCTQSFIGGKAQKIQKSTATYLVGSEYTWDQVSVSLAGAGISTVKSLTFTGNNSLKAWGSLDGTKYNGRIVRDGFRTLEVSGVMLLDGDAQKDIFRAGTTQNLKMTVTGQAVSSGYNAQLVIEVPAFKYSEFPDNISGPGMLEVSFKGKAVYETGSAHMVKFTVCNTQAAY
jgi:hypothetical protein